MLSPELQELTNVLDRTITDKADDSLAYISIGGRLVFLDAQGGWHMYKLEKVN